MVLETGIFASHAIWLWRVRHTRAAAKKAGKSYDEYVAEHPEKKLPHCESSETFVVDVEAGGETKSSETCTEKMGESPVTGGAPEAQVQAPPPAVVKSG